MYVKPSLLSSEFLADEASALPIGEFSEDCKTFAFLPGLIATILASNQAP